MSKTDDSLNAAFDIDMSAVGTVETANMQAMTVTATVQTTEVAPFIEHVAEDEDFEEVRSNLKTLVRKGNKMLDRMIEIADSSERDRTFEVAGTLLKNLAEINKDVLASRKTHKENKVLGKQTDGKTVDDGGSINIDKAVFVGTTADLLKQVKQSKNNG